MLIYIFQTTQLIVLSIQSGYLHEKKLCSSNLKESNEIEGDERDIECWNKWY